MRNSGSTLTPNGQKIRHLRKLRKLSQEELAGLTGYDRRTIQRIEHGENTQPTTLGDVAEALGVTLAELVEPSAPDLKASQRGPDVNMRTVDASLTATGTPERLMGNVPPPPELLIGRDDAIANLKRRLGVTPDGSRPGQASTLTVMRGWPGVGKSTLAAALARDPDIGTAFTDGVLWASLGPDASPLAELAAWGRALGDDKLLLARTAEEASRRLMEILHSRRMLLVVDDVWKPEQAQAFRFGGPECATIMATRLPSVADAIAGTPEAVYVVSVLDEVHSLELLATLAPEVVDSYPDEAESLVQELEGLPLALQVAGRLLNTEWRMGWGVDDLLKAIREDARVLAADAPPDCADLVRETTPSVAALLRKSTDRLSPKTGERFAMLGPFAPKPATFGVDAMAAAWDVQDPKPTIRELVDRGLLEPAANSRFQMHALLVTHARALLGE